MSVDATATMAFRYYLTRIQNLYSQYNLSNVQNVNGLLKQFPGKEYQVYAQICKKCGVEPEKEPTPEEIAAGTIPVDTKVWTWLTNKGHKSYAEMPSFLSMNWETFLTISTENELRVQGVHPQHARALLMLIRLEALALAKPEEPEAIVEEPPTLKPVDQFAEKPLAEPVPKSDFKVGDNCFTKVLAGEDEVEEGWLSAKIMRVNKDNTFDIFVNNAKSHGVPPEAVSVPRSFLKKSVENVKITKPPHPDSTKFATGDRVWICGLRSHQLYNGLCGTILMFHEKRYQVHLDSGETFAIRAGNLFPWDVDVPEAAVEAGKERLKSAGFASQADENVLSDLITRLMRYDTSGRTDHVKVGQFAAGYLIGEQRHSNGNF